MHLNPANINLANGEKKAQEDYVAIHKVYLNFLCQNEKMKWIRQGDDNSLMFHGLLSKYRFVTLFLL